jgi:2-polyprenyl-3-methyl-5-hydroxy-6-metoxy-1,4-benzoquinol methylase
MTTNCYCGNVLTTYVQHNSIRDIMICQNCCLIYDMTSYKNNINSYETQLTGLNNIYIFNKSVLEDKIICETKFIDELCNFCKKHKELSFNNKTLLDIGCANGLRRYGFIKNNMKYFATDLNADLFSVYNKDNMNEFICIENLQNYKFDFLFCWHTLEHFTSVNDFITLINNVSKKNTIMILQIPCFDIKHLFDCHFLFFNKTSLIYLFNILGYSTITFYHDENNNFLTYIGEKNI